MDTVEKELQVLGEQVAPSKTAKNEAGQTPTRSAWRGKAFEALGSGVRSVISLFEKHTHFATK